MSLSILYLHFGVLGATGVNLEAFSARFFEIGPISGLQLLKFHRGFKNDRGISQVPMVGFC